LCIEAVLFKSHEKTGSVGVKKLEQKHIAAELIAERIEARGQQQNQKQYKPEWSRTKRRAIYFGGRRFF
jgi:hypothetical protein